MFLAVSGAFTGADVPLLTRFAYWIPVMLGGAVLGRLMAWLVIRIPRAASNEWLFALILAVAITVPVTLAIWIYTSSVFHLRFTVATLPFFTGGVFLVSLVMTVLMMLISRPGRMTHARTQSAAPAPTPRFFERLPPKLKGGVLYAVAAEDHYLRLHTSKGTDLILMRLSDAIAELDGVEGAQTHRSWWVAKNAVESTRRDGDRLILVLKGGAEAPVSRPNVRVLREAGWY